jgi:hypothetical protein
LGLKSTLKLSTDVGKVSAHSTPLLPAHNLPAEKHQLQIKKKKKKKKKWKKI